MQLELPCDRLMYIGLKDHCRLYYDDGVSIPISLMIKEEQEQALGSGHPLAPRCETKLNTGTVSTISKNGSSAFLSFAHTPNSSEPLDNFREAEKPRRFERGFLWACGYLSD